MLRNVYDPEKMRHVYSYSVIVGDNLPKHGRAERTHAGSNQAKVAGTFSIIYICTVETFSIGVFLCLTKNVSLSQFCTNGTWL